MKVSKMEFLLAKLLEKESSVLSEHDDLYTLVM